MKLSDATQRYLSYLKNEIHSSPHTINNYAIDLRQFSEFLGKLGFKDGAIHHISAKDIRNVLFSYENIRPSSRSRKLSTLRSFFAFLHKRGILHQDVARSVSHPKKPKLLPKPVRMEQIFEFLSKEPAWKNFKEARSFLIFAILFGCGLRISELCGLKLTHISSENDWIRVTGKGRKERDLPLPQKLQRYLEKYLPLRQDAYPKNPFLFPGSLNAALSPRTIQRTIEQIAALSAQFHEPFSPHQLRHSFASHLLTSGANLKGIQELLGHQHLTSTEIYTHIHTQRLMEVMEKYHPTATTPPSKKPPPQKE